jgi:hypothetical protein
MPIQVTEEDFHDHLKARMSHGELRERKLNAPSTMVGKQPMRNVVR